ncbi:MAG: acyltransferase family protein [Bacteroidales bacterium]|nr:acyltransferase family protein [Bacteroidales bacterium]
MNSKEREPIYDNLKGLGIILVILGHITKNSDLTNCIYVFHMPLFFFVSGMLYHTKKNYVLNQAKSLMLPYLLFSIFSFVYWSFIELKFREKRAGSDLIDQLINIFYPMNMPGGYEFNIVLWFLPCFFVTTVLYHFYTTKIHFEHSDVVLLVLSVLLAILVKVRIPFFISEMFCAIPFFVSGRLFLNLRQEDFFSEDKFKSQRFALSSFLLIAVFFWIVRSGMKSNMQNMVYSYGYLLFYFCAVAVIYSLYDFLLVLRRSRVLQWLGRNSLCIMLVHEPIKRILIKLYSMIFSSSVDFVRESFVHTFVILVIVLVISSAITWVVNRYAKCLLGKF